MQTNLPVVAGAISTTLFALSTLPMLFKAFRTKDLSSYSLGNFLFANVGNGVHSFYVFSLPSGPIWVLHSFYLVTSGLMLVWYLRYEWQPGEKSGSRRRRMPPGIAPAGPWKCVRLRIRRPGQAGRLPETVYCLPAQGAPLAGGCKQEDRRASHSGGRGAGREASGTVKGPNRLCCNPI